MVEQDTPESSQLDAGALSGHLGTAYDVDYTPASSAAVKPVPQVWILCNLVHRIGLLDGCFKALMWGCSSPECESPYVQVHSFPCACLRMQAASMRVFVVGRLFVTGLLHCCCFGIHYTGPVASSFHHSCV